MGRGGPPPHSHLRHVETDIQSPNQKVVESVLKPRSFCFLRPVLLRSAYVSKSKSLPTVGLFPLTIKHGLGHV